MLRYLINLNTYYSWRKGYGVHVLTMRIQELESGTSLSWSVSYSRRLTYTMAETNIRLSRYLFAIWIYFWYLVICLMFAHAQKLNTCNLL